MDPLVSAHDAPLSIDDGTGAHTIGRPLVDECIVTPGRNEAEPLALAFGRPGEAERDGARPNLRFARLPQRKREPSQLGLRQRVQKVTLVLAGVGGAVKL